jgi:4-amino-4-deoxy-L-arabinose transferase-like glycosyltransferase
MLRFLAIAAVSAALYTYQLDRVPAFLTLDEAHFSVHAHALAETGRNLNGQRLPMLISLEDPEGETYRLPWGQTYYLPFGMYLIAAALQVLPLDEASVRLPAALLGGVINVGLIFAVAHVLFRNRLAALCSAAILALTPANVIISRQALDSVCQLPFTLGCLWCLGKYLRAPNPQLALAAGAILGLGVYAYVTSIVFMPFFLAVFWLIAWRAGVLGRRAWLWSMAGFAAALTPMILWLLWHPDALASIGAQYNRADPGATTLMQAMASGGLTSAVREFVRIYWSYFDPSFLFVQGGNARNLSTGEVGVFLAPIAVLAAWGVWQLRTRREVQWLLIIGLLSAPIPAAIKGTPYQIQRASGLLIFVSLAAGFGLAALWASPAWAPKPDEASVTSGRRRLSRAVAVGIALVMAWQFAGFYRDYLGDYRIRSGHAYDSTAFRTTAEAIVAEDQRSPIERVYLPSGYYDAGAKWRFYTIKHERPALWARTEYYANTGALAAAPRGSVAVVPVTSDRPLEIAGWSTVDVMRNLPGDPMAVIIRRGSP